MGDLGNMPEPAPPAPRNRRVLARRALACELTGELDLAMKLIRCLHHGNPDHPAPAARDRRIA